MHLELLHPEPDLEFANGNKCPDIRFGIGHFGIHDFDSRHQPSRIKLGFVGTDETISSLTSWLDTCRGEVREKPSNQPRLYPPFPGFAPSHSFFSTLVWDLSEVRTVTIPDNLEPTRKTFNSILNQVTDIYAKEVENALEKLDVNVVLVAPPLEHLKVTTLVEDEPDDDNEEESADDEETEVDGAIPIKTRLDFHDMLKAKTLHLRIPIQIVLPATYDESKATAQKKIINRDQQDEATRAWNLHTALYYKARGIPWRLVKGPSEFSTCYLGVSFFRTLDKQRIYASSAQVFNDRGEGVIVKGGLAYQDKDDREIYLDEKGAYDIARKSLDTFWSEHHHYPARVALHKTSSFTDAEVSGFRSALQEKSITWIDLVHVKDFFVRLFRTEDYPPLRGTLWHLQDRKGILYTKGSVVFYETYPGKYPPRSLYIDTSRSNKPFKELARETLELTKMNWNSTRFDGQLPITLRAARQVGRILKYLNDNDVKRIPSAYRFYM